MKFSVIMPAYNAEDTIYESIQSVLMQDYSDYELIVVDDGSTDNTSKVVHSIMDKRVKLVQMQNGGVSVARNRGIDEATGAYICFLDSDDCWFPNHLTTIDKLICTKEDVQIAVTGYQIKDFNGKIVKQNYEINRFKNGSSFIVDDYIRFVQHYKQFIHINSLCVKKSLINKIGGFQIGERIGEDTDFIYRITSFCPISVSPLITTEYRRNQTSTTAKRNFNYSWSFMTHGLELLGDDRISDDKKKSIRWVMETYKISMIRNCLLEGEKRRAFDILKQIDLSFVSLIHFSLTIIMFLVPRRMLHLMALYRDRGMYE